MARELDERERRTDTGEPFDRSLYQWAKEQIVQSHYSKRPQLMAQENNGGMAVIHTVCWLGLKS